MNGSWHIYRPGERWERPRSEMRVLIETDAFVAVGFNVPVAELLDGRQLERSPELRRLGPDVLAADFDPAAAISRLRARGELPVHEALLDQSVLAGLGNVYRSEILFLARLPPDRLVGRLDDQKLAEVVALARKLLLANADPASSAAITTYSGLRRTTGRGNPGERLWVYGRRGKPCRACGTPIAYRKVGRDVRGLYFCPRCQEEATA
jgi:endonuclease-8